MGGAKKLVKKATGVVKKLPGGKLYSKYAEAMNPLLRVAQGKNIVGRDLGAYLGMAGPAAMDLGGGFAKGSIDPETGEYISPIEMESGIRMPKYESLRDKATGKLKSDFAFDPYQGEMAQRLKSEATSTGFSPWAQAKLQQQTLEEQGQKDTAARTAQQGLSQGMSGLARFGGLSGGARERMGAQSARDLLMSKQDVARQGMLGRAGIQTEDLGRKQGLQGQFATAEQQAQAANLEAMRGDVTGKQQFDLSKYKDLMAAYGAQKSSDAQARAAKQSSGKK
jgi:hypothetical protein